MPVLVSFSISLLIHVLNIVQPSKSHLSANSLGYALVVFAQHDNTASIRQTIISKFISRSYRLRTVSSATYAERSSTKEGRGQICKLGGAHLALGFDTLFVAPVNVRFGVGRLTTLPPFSVHP